MIKTEYYAAREYADVHDMQETFHRIIRDEIKDAHDQSPWDFLRIPDDQIVDSWRGLVRALNPDEKTIIVVVGIGGSCLGLQALHALMGCATTRPLYVLDSCVPSVVLEQLSQVEHHIRSGGRIVVCVISKSGTTMETMVNAQLLANLLQTINPQGNLYKHVIITDAGSPLHTLARETGAYYLEIPRSVGGRFSVFTAVGMVPLLLCGIDVQALMDGARASVDELLSQSNTLAIDLARRLVHAHQADKRVLNIFMGDTQLLFLGMWIRQLVGESLGKNEQVGFVPTVSLMTQDLHSVVQTYLAGPDVISTLFIDRDTGDTVRLVGGAYTARLGLPSEITCGELCAAIAHGVRLAYRERRREYGYYSLSRDAFDYGRFMIMCMSAVALAGRALGVDVFNQPEVELYKQKARALLRR